ncbi:FAD-dependent oxidoreductase [Pandoraea oxalativorans]|uniref:Fumarate reductase n=1 Tax=Pandoraea oxalativorans TaxID=573737 RepID=A0A0E3U7V9_9BURK|nr:FAD-dependent oxidoreductase [Pandoraea oxalativorans]AKC70773.1 fumarate reductase [Pandoraea oxalativorans]
MVAFLKASEQRGAHAQWHATYDVVVVGYGAAGAVAAIEAADAGARVLLIEKMPDPGGISILSAGGVRVCDDADAAFAYLQHTCGGRTPDDVLRALAVGMTEVPDYLRELARTNDAVVRVDAALGNYPFPGCDSLAYADIESIPGFGDPAGYLAARPFRPGCLLFKLLLDNVEARSAQGRIDVWLSTRVERLEQGERREVLGVRVRRGDESLRVRAQRAVVLACGGFEADEEMKRQFFVSTPVLPGSFRGNTGDGIRMAQAAGAALWHMWHHHGPYGIRHPDPSYPFGIYAKILPMWTPERETKPLPKMAWIVVDQRGRRYVNEYPPYISDTGVRQFDHYDPSAYRHDRLPSYLIFDEAGRRMYPMGRSITNDREAWYEWSSDNLKEVENGLLQKADTLDALAEKLGIDAAGLARTVREWNAGCEAGHDDAFGRRPETMTPLTEGPFYAASLWPVVINTQGGPVHDAAQRVLDPFGEPIAGLYAAGELGSVFGHIYMAGGNLAECIVGGRIAGRNAARACDAAAARGEANSVDMRRA